MTLVLRDRTLFESDELRIVSRLYAPAAFYAPHRDERSRLTMTLAGAVAEDTRHGSATIGVGDLLLKSRATVHENRYAPEGARQVSIEFLSEDSDPDLKRALDDMWAVRRDADALRHTASVLDAAVAGDGIAVSAAISDMAATVAEAPSRRSAPPPWLDALRDDLEEGGLAAVDVAARAREAGVHPVHASRLFRGCYGASITDHAQLHAIRRAVAELASGASLSAASAAAGFYDQSHMSRVFRRIVGRTPGAQQRLCAAAAC